MVRPIHFDALGLGGGGGRYRVPSPGNDWWREEDIVHRRFGFPNVDETIVAPIRPQ